MEGVPVRTAFKLWALSATAFMFAGGVNADWSIAPSVFNEFFQLEGPDAVLYTADDVFGIYSGYSGGEYINALGATVTADVSMTSTVTQLFPNVWWYEWTITNQGTGDFVQYLDTGNGPNFLQNPPLSFGETEDNKRFGGPPRIGSWGGAWNPEVSPEAQRYDPVPEASTLLLFGSGLAGMLKFFRRRSRNGF